MKREDSGELHVISGGLVCKIVISAMASYGVAKVYRAVLNYFCGPAEPGLYEMPLLDSGRDSNRIKIMSYNVWSREDIELNERMKAMGNLIQHHSPDVICFQEVTSNIYDIFKQSSWWKSYHSSVSNELAANTRPYFCMQLSKLPVKSSSRKAFGKSRIGRELCMVEIEPFMGKSLIVATSHLPSARPSPPYWDPMHSEERVAQAKKALNLLKNYRNVIFCGDMNWIDELDGCFPLSHGWVDAWTELRPMDNGWTFDTESNRMLWGNRSVQNRLDRFICKLVDFNLSTINMIGTEEIPGLLYKKWVENKLQWLVLPILPSDHYGLVLEIYSID